MRILSKDHPFHRHEMADLGSVTLASFRRRANAFGFDCLLSFTPYLAVAAIDGFYARRAAAPTWLPEAGTIKWLTFGVFFVYVTLATYLLHGQTLGKRWQKIRVVALFAPRLTLWQCFERSLGYSASCLEVGFGFFQYFLHPNRQTVHDRIAETVVINTE